MAIETKISWCDSTCNAEMGCKGCEIWQPDLRMCYAGISTEQRAGRKGWPKSFSEPELFVHRIAEAIAWPDLTGKNRPNKQWLNGMPRIIFLDDEGDTFTEGLPIDWLAPHLDGIGRSRHVWLPLTKRPNRARQFFEQHRIPENMWIGASVTDQPHAEGRVPDLLAIPDAPVRFLSVEPVLGPVDLSRWITEIDWVIVGGASGLLAKDHPMKPEWARKIRDQCEAADVPLFYKQSSGRWPESEPTLDGKEWRQMPRVKVIA